ncbi:putative glutaredoxin, Thioredoxin-like superfamily [Helianthus annuus]|nr:putative glutaredoxin, Thioredoxin-like superfamily [Helianthus annuus]
MFKLQIPQIYRHAVPNSRYDVRVCVTSLTFNFSSRLFSLLSLSKPTIKTTTNPTSNPPPPPLSLLSLSKTMQTSGNGGPPNATTVDNMVIDNAVMVFGQRGCCMCHVAKLLLLGLGVNPTISAVDEGDVAEVVSRLSKISGESVIAFPVVFVGGKLFGGLERLVAMHITGELVPLLKEAKALWL